MSPLRVLDYVHFHMEFHVMYRGKATLQDASFLQFLERNWTKAEPLALSMFYKWHKMLQLCQTLHQKLRIN